MSFRSSITAALILLLLLWILSLSSLPHYSLGQKQQTDEMGSSSLERPNLLVILTDQERYHMHWPPGLLEKLMPSWARLKSHGLTFERAYASVSQCSPSRAALVSGEYSVINKVATLNPFFPLPNATDLPNIATVLGAVGYDVVYKGKWHLSQSVKGGGSPSHHVPPQDEVWSEDDIADLQARYGMRSWNPPDCGNTAGAYLPVDNTTARAAQLTVLGGGTANNDGRILTGNQSSAGGGGGGEETPGFGTSAIEYLTEFASTPADERQPFALFVSFVNPHDVTMFPNAWDEAGYELESFANLPVELPNNMYDDLSTKPSVQSMYKAAVDSRSPFGNDGANSNNTDNTELNYAKFYAYLHSVVEPHISGILDAMDRFGLTNDTVVVRTSDHGELGLSHGLREKSYTAYEEVIHVPLVFSNPVLFSEPATTKAFWSHVDLLPTLASLANATPVGVGKNQAVVLRDPDQSVQDCVLFTFDDSFLLSGDVQNSHIRALREGQWTYAVYYTPDGSSFEFELYDNESDPGQLENLLYSSPGTDIVPEWIRLHKKLVAKMEETRATPIGFVFPTDPVAVHPKYHPQSSSEGFCGYDVFIKRFLPVGLFILFISLSSRAILFSFGLLVVIVP